MRVVLIAVPYDSGRRGERLGAETALALGTALVDAARASLT